MAIGLERRKPRPVPPVRPVWEFQATGDLEHVYGNYKSALRVPWVGVVSMAYAHYRHFFDAWWAGFAPIAETDLYVRECEALRRRIEAHIDELAPPPLAGKLRGLGYSQRELDQIREMIEVLSHGNFAQMPAVFAARLALEGHVPTGEHPSDLGPPPPAPEHSTPFVLVEPHHVLADQTAIYEDIKRTIGLPFVNTDYRCLARWPSYFALAWDDLRSHIPTERYEALAQIAHNDMTATTLALPNLGKLSAERVLDGARTDGDVSECLAVTQLFTWLLPGLMLNVAFFRRQLQD